MGSPEMAQPRLVDSSFASSFRLTKREVIRPADDGHDAAISQFGAAYLDGSITLPNPPDGRVGVEPLIDMFVCGADGSCQATGEDAVIAGLWQPAVQAMVDAVFDVCKRFDVPVAPTAYVTASFTPGADVVGTAHFDDDQFLPDAGVGVVAILGSDSGPRVATEPVAVSAPRPGLPLDVEQAEFDRFTNGDLPFHQAAPGRMVIFPQFGQMHAGPALASTNPDVTRRLLVMRAETVPVDR